MLAARAWSTWEGRTSRLIPDADLIERISEDQFAEAFARIECHYFINGGFFQDDGYLLDNIARIQHLPAIIIQGRYDIVCPAESAYELHRAWPGSQFHVVPDAGHSALERGIADRLVAATKSFAS